MACAGGGGLEQDDQQSDQLERNLKLHTAFLILLFRNLHVDVIHEDSYSHATQVIRFPRVHRLILNASIIASDSLSNTHNGFCSPVKVAIEWLSQKASVLSCLITFIGHEYSIMH